MKSTDSLGTFRCAVDVPRVSISSGHLGRMGGGGRVATWYVLKYSN